MPCSALRTTKQSNLKLKTRLVSLLAFLLLAFQLPGIQKSSTPLSHICMANTSFNLSNGLTKEVLSMRTESHS